MITQLVIKPFGDLIKFIIVFGDREIHFPLSYIEAEGLFELLKDYLINGKENAMKFYDSNLN